MRPRFTNLSYEEIFGRNVKACREAAGLTQKELAEDVLGVPEDLIQQIEAGKACDIRIDTYICLANCFHVPLEGLLANVHLTIPKSIKPLQSDKAQTLTQNTFEDEYLQLYNKLMLVVNEISPYYDVDKIKPTSVYVWTKDGDNDDDKNVFDIHADEIVFYDKEHEIFEEVKPIIKKIQAVLQEFSLLAKENV